MGFVRQQINNTSTFTTGEEVIPVNIPTFQLWENTSKDIRYDLGAGWSINIPNDSSDLNFQLNGDIILNIQKTGGIQEPILALTDYPSEGNIPGSYNQSGLLARINGELYMSESQLGPS